MKSAKSLKILHLAPDEKFIDMGLRAFKKVAPHSNQLLVISDTPVLKYIESEVDKIFSESELDSEKFSNYIYQFDVVVLHSLCRVNIPFPKHVKTLWIGFGMDYYDLISDNFDDLLLPKTRQLNSLSQSKIFKLKRALKKIPAVEKVHRKLHGQKTKSEYLQRIDYFAPVLESEYEMVASKDAKFKPKFADWNYGTLEDDLVKDLPDLMSDAQYILLGNSATITNNHVDAFELLEQLDLKDRKIICPLSYGDEDYRNKVLNRGKDIFGANFLPITKFMSVDNYLSTLSSCSVVIMNHLRQQALGNIITMLYRGATVFLNKQNPVYDFFKEQGAVLYAIDELEADNSLINYRLTPKEVELNKSILLQHWSRQAINNKTEQLINKLMSN
ncbi:TDP-N-acetylfucosamine:lipid II N-acetylfucosaminyltransferase [Thalassotalea ponticola]|uniref:TDP-N-acetylfucosamine:lipid II N-acetylfucosaminyltransferase n=1 Tax=Thalassotalea ponticola TaxID=1523392 RepID=UPI0025B4B7A7|nr:TDP-N-acetylfucosamine:lipid II N-acetylfucosaminyltransferase [Thalassotalea ponticola]MDN3652650.1 TDP-N-acetylfucosamine:lipid II N-acetylfucosaminyltransferase [Thalassotalea ponticola]